MNMHFTDRGRLILIAFVGAVIFAGIVVLDVVLIPERYANLIHNRWFRFGFVSLVGFAWIFLQAYWKLRKRALFWLIFFGFFLVHLIGVGYLFIAYGGLSTVPLVVIAGLEGCLWHF